jgi:cardiolipin synthase A/B
MPGDLTGTNYRWLCTGQEAFPAMLGAIEAAQHSVCLESYIFSAGALGERFSESPVRARQRGASVRVLVDALGSLGLAGRFWRPLRAAGGEVRLFNPLSLNRLGIRNHRKLLVCDEQVAFVGGFNIAPEYEGDGVTHGWYDIGLKLEGPLAGRLAAAFEEMFARASFQHKRFVRFHKSGAKKSVPGPSEELLLSGPGRGRNPIKSALRRDLARARSVQIMMAYFLPTWRLRRQLAGVARREGQVQLMLAGKSDVAVSQLAGQSLYRRFLKAGVEIEEHQPQVFHAKLIIIDDSVYVGSANLDQRSRNINYELMIRFENPEMARQGREVFAGNLRHCRQVTLEGWQRSRSLWRKLKEYWAYLLLVRIDPLIARRQWRALPD